MSTDIATVKKELRKVWNANAVIVFLLGIVLVSLAHLDLTSSEFLIEIVQEIGFALIVSVVIWTSFEYATHTKAEERMQGHVQMISEEVIRGVFKKRFPERYITEIVKSNIEHNFIRTEIGITYTITDKEFRARDGKSAPYVRLSAIASYKILNVSHEIHPHKVGIGLPNPLIDEMKSDCFVTKVSVRGKDVDISKSQTSLLEELKNDKKTLAMFVVQDDFMINPGEEVEVKINYSMAKEEEDTEMFQTLYPAQSIKITVNDTNPKKRVVRAKSMHRCSLQEDVSYAGEGTYTFSLDEYVLPRQGFAIWWKKIPPVLHQG